MASLQERTGTYRVIFRFHGKQCFVMIGKVSLEEAEAKAAQVDLDAYELAIRRELDDEVEVHSEGRIIRLGLINDDSTPVGSVRLGIVHIYEFHHPAVKPREEGLADPEFIEISELRRY